MIKRIVIILLPMLAVLLLKFPLEAIFNSYGLSEGRSEYLAGIICRLLLVTIGIVLIRKMNFQQAAGLDTPFRIKNARAIVLPLLIFGAALYSNRSTYLIANQIDLMLFIVFVVSVGLAEELIFRGYLFPLIARHTKKIVLAMVLSSILFGSIHYINLFRQADNFSGITSQALFATCIGISFCGFLLRIQNIYVIGILHALFNLSFGSSQLKYMYDTPPTGSAESSDIASIITTLAVFGLIAVSGFVMKKWANDEVFFRKLLLKKEEIK